MSERRCILTGDRADPALLVRLALSPDGMVMPDVRAKAPGRGAWVGVSRGELESALAKGKLKSALMRAFKTGPVEIPADLPQLIDDALERQAMDRLGLEARASNIVTGSEKIEVAARRGQVHMLMHAADAAADGCRKLDQAWRVGEDMEGTDRAGQVLPVGREALSKAMGRDNVVHLGVSDAAAAQRIGAVLSRWQSYRGCANGDRRDALPEAQAAEMSNGQP
ncbi:MAG: DUF448 domain-containing protein [Sphingobium sp.]|nr:DUF448 domain-containing protein [Sphingobium sp.]MCP5400154.1 DUF448 domain-containing protein [Sphingomonas sp.]